MSQIDSISQLMLGLGNVRADEARQVIAQQELERQNRHRVLNGTLRVLGAIAPYALSFIPGVGPFLGAGLGMMEGGGMYNNMGIPQGYRGSRDPAFLDPSQYPDILVNRR